MVVSFVRIWHKWGLKAGLSIIDQGIFSGANFVLNILLARWFMPAEYGIFAIAFSILLFLSSFHQAFILEPMSVIGAAYYQDRLSVYVGVTVWIHVFLTLFLAVITALIAVIMSVQKNLAVVSFLGLAVAIPLILFLWLFRQACYVQARPNLALKSSLVYAFLLGVGLFFIRKQNWLSSSMALCVMGFASISSSLIFWRSLGVKMINPLGRQNRTIVSDIVTKNWHYGKWGIGGAFVNWLSSLIYLPLVGVFVGLPQAGVFRAIQNIFLPVQRTCTALGLLFLPSLSKQRVNEGVGYLKRNAAKFITANTLLSGSYVITIILLGKLVIRLLYGQGYYINFVWLVPYLGMVVIMESLAQGLYVGLKALERPDAIFWTHTIGTILTLTFGLNLIAKLKLYGAAIASLLTITLITVLLAYFFWDCLNKKNKGVA